MSIDNSVANPGKMGWGISTDPVETTILKEERAFEQLAANQPQMLMQRAPREPNAKLIAKLKELMALDGQVGGFRASYAEELVFGVFLRWLAQIIGSCVASGAGRAVTRRSLIEIFLLNDPEELLGTSLIGPDNVCPFLPYSYRAGRRIAGLNSGDGSLCSPHVEGMRNGILMCSAANLSQYTDAFPEPQNAATYRRWGNSNNLMDMFAAEARKIKLVESVRIRDAQQGKENTNVGMKPAMICSSWAFRPDYAHRSWRDRNGNPIWVYKRDRGNTWMHNMTIDGTVVVETDEEFTWVDNSWGPRAHKNGSAFPIRTEEYDEWCRNSEQMTIGELDLLDNSLPVG